jgi:hypothetical protein
MTPIGAAGVFENGRPLASTSVGGAYYERRLLALSALGRSPEPLRRVDVPAVRGNGRGRGRT